MAKVHLKKQKPAITKLAGLAITISNLNDERDIELRLII